MTITHYLLLTTLWKRVFPYIIFTVLLLIYAPDYYGRLFPSDAVSYLSIAEKYAAGNIGTAVNTYWSPMVSWLIALQIKLGVPAISAFHIIKFFSGLLLIFFAGKIIRLYQWPVWAHLAGNMIIAAWAAYFTLHYLSPDVLMAAGLLIYLYLVLSGKWLQRPWLTGLLGATLYFTKAFGFYFFATHLLLYICWKLMADKKHLLHIIRKWLMVAAVFLLVSMAWMAALHHRYGQWIISSAGNYNHSLMQYGNGSVQPVLHSGLLPLPDSLAYNSWEEITLVHHYADWKPWQSKPYFLLQLKVIRNNSWYILQHLYGANRFSWLAIAAAFLITVFYVYKKIFHKNYLINIRKTAHVSVFVMLYCFGYAVAGVDERYLYIADMGLLLILIDLLVMASKKIKVPVIVCYVVAGLLVLSCMIAVTSKLNFFKTESFSQIAEVKSLKQIVPPQSRIATHQTNAINAMDYMGQWHNHGGLQAYQNKDSALHALHQYGINWVLIPDSVGQRYTWLTAKSHRIFSVKNWKVYQLK